MNPTARRQSRKHLTSVAAALGVILLLLIVFRGTASRLFATIQRPLVGAGTFITNHVPTFGDGDSLAGRLDDLERQRNALALDFAQLERLRTENEQLKAQVSFLSRRTERHVGAAIISRTATNQSATFVIDRGEADGVQIGSPVIVAEGHLIGKVTSVTRGTATVTATTDDQMATAATLLNESRTIGIAQGSRGRLITLSFIPHGEQINVNDLVVTSGLEDRVPSGLVIGIVNTVSADPSLPFQEAVVEPLADVSEHRIVSVLIEEAL